MSAPLGGDTARLREELLATSVAAERAERQRSQHQAEADRWQRRVELAERGGQAALAAEAAAQARQHAGLALAAAEDLAKLRAHVEKLQASLRAPATPPPPPAVPTIPGVDPVEARLAQLDRDATADAQLEALKARLRPRSESEGKDEQ